MDSLTPDIIRRAAAGDARAFEQIYRQYSGFVYRVARRLTAEDAAEDITQDVFLQVYHKLVDFEERSTLKTWIYRMTINAAINHSKKQSRVTRRERSFADPEVAAGAAMPPATAAVVTADLLETLLARLTPDLRLCLSLRSIEGLTYEEIAEHLDISINTVRSRLKRAREKLLTLRSGVLGDELG